MSDASTVTREPRTTPARSVPNFIQDSHFFTSAQCRNLMTAGGLEFVGGYQFLIGLCLSSPGYYEELQKGDYSNVSKIIGMRKAKFQRFVDTLVGLKLAYQTDQKGIGIEVVVERERQFHSICDRNARNRKSNVSAKTAESKESVRPVVKDSLTSPTTPTPITTPIPTVLKEGGPGETKPIGPKALLEQMGEQQVDALRMRFNSEGLNDDDLREAFWHAAAKLTKDPEFHAYHWISCYGPEHARAARISKNKLATSQQIQKKTAPQKVDHPSFRPAEGGLMRADPKVGAMISGLAKQLGAKI